MCYLCRQMTDDLHIKIFSKTDDLPPLSSHNFFHSPELFRIIEQSRGQQPYMVVAFADGKPVAHLLAMLRRRGSLLPPYLFTQGKIHGEGEYEEGVDCEQLFALMVKAITRRLRRKMCLYIEITDLSQKMFGYKSLRLHGYFPVHWSAIHNSLHSKAPIERLSEKMRERIARVESNGLVFSEVETPEDFNGFYRLFRHFFTLKIRRYMPSEEYFQLMMQSNHCRLFVTKLREKVIGGCACFYSDTDAALWMMASKRKSYPTLHPGTATLWGAMNHAWHEGYDHFRFLDVGLPYRKNPIRDFILRFGGKEVSTYRWFRFSLPWLNRIIGWFYRE